MWTSRTSCGLDGEAVDFTEKLWGPVASLVKTASFVIDKGLDIVPGLGTNEEEEEFRLSNH